MSRRIPQTCKAGHGAISGRGRIGIDHRDGIGLTRQAREGSRTIGGIHRIPVLPAGTVMWGVASTVGRWSTAPQAPPGGSAR